MKIVIISEYFPQNYRLDFTGGMETRGFFVGRELAKKHQVTILTSRIGSAPKEQTLAGMQIRRVGSPRAYTRTGIWERIYFVISCFRQFDYSMEVDLVEANGFWSYLPAWVIGAIKRCKRVAVVADTMAAYTSGVNQFVRFALLYAEKILLTRSWNRVICISQTVKRKVASLIGANNVDVIYCGVDTTIIKQIKTQKKPQQLLTIARLVSYKRVGDLVHAFIYLAPKYPQLTLKIIGTGEELEALRAIAKDYQSRIKFLGFVKNYTQIIRKLKQATIFCLPSLVEGFGIVTVEALAAGTPAVVADIPINREVTKNKGTLYFQPSNPRDLSLKLEQLLLDQKMYQRLKKEATGVTKQYDWQKIGKETEAVYARLCTN